MNTKWRYNSPKEYLPKLVEMFGPPSIKDYNPGGLALWYKKDLDKHTVYGLPNCFDEILIRDESVRHRCPANHNDFLYSYVLVDIGPDVLPIINSISGSISYDPLKKLLSARCGNLEANIATLALATDILTDKVPNDVYKAGLANLYGEMIKSTSDPKIAKKLYKNLCENLGELGRPSPSDYWVGAFSADCSDPKAAFAWYSVCNKANKILKQNKFENDDDDDNDDVDDETDYNGDDEDDEEIFTILYGGTHNNKPNKAQYGGRKKNKPNKAQYGGAKKKNKKNKPNKPKRKN